MEVEYNDSLVLGESRYGSSTVVYSGILVTKVTVKRILNENRCHSGEIQFARLDHPNIVKFLQRSSEILFTRYAFEFCVGSMDQLWDCQSSLHDKIREEALVMPPHDNVLTMLTEGLSYIHSQGLIHGELRPENVLFSSNSAYGRPATIKLADFGLSIQPMDGNIWMAPELLIMLGEKFSRKAKREDLRAENDLFSIGCVFFYFLSKGKHPFSVYDSKEDTMDIMGRITSKLHIDAITLSSSPIINFQNDSYFPRDHFAYDIIRKLLTKNPAAARVSLPEVKRLLLDIKNTFMNFASYDNQTNEASFQLSRRIQQKMDPNCIRNSMTPLLLLCRFYTGKHSLHDQLKELIDAGASVFHKNERGRNALLLLCKHQINRVEKADLLRCIKLLLDVKIDVNEVDWNERNALQCIERYCWNHDTDVDEIIMLLIERGIRIKLGGLNELHFLVLKYSSRETLLNEVIQISLERDGVTRINAKDQHERTVFHLLSEKCKNRDIVFKLLHIKEIDKGSMEWDEKMWLAKGFIHVGQKLDDWSLYFKIFVGLTMIGLALYYTYEPIRSFLFSWMSTFF